VNSFWIHVYNNAGALRGFFDDGKKLRKNVCKCMIDRLRRLAEWFAVQHQLRFYASSLLLVYDSMLSPI